MTGTSHQALVEQLADSLARPLLSCTPGRVFGRTGLPAKATAVTGMQRAGETTFLHQLRGQRIEHGIPPERLPRPPLARAPEAEVEERFDPRLVDICFHQMVPKEFDFHALRDEAINKTQLGSFPVPMPPIELQHHYARFVEKARCVADIAGTAAGRIAGLNASLMSGAIEADA